MLGHDLNDAQVNVRCPTRLYRSSPAVAQSLLPQRVHLAPAAPSRMGPSSTTRAAARRLSPADGPGGTARQQAPGVVTVGPSASAALAVDVRESPCHLADLRSRHQPTDTGQHLALPDRCQAAASSGASQRRGDNSPTQWTGGAIAGGALYARLLAAVGRCECRQDVRNEIRLPLMALLRVSAPWQKAAHMSASLPTPPAWPAGFAHRGTRLRPALGGMRLSTISAPPRYHGVGRLVLCGGVGPRLCECLI